MKRPMKSIRKLLCAAFTIICILSIFALPASADQAAESTKGTAPKTEVMDDFQRVRFLPTSITVSSKEAVVEGYVVNTNEDITISDLKDITATVYMDGKKAGTAKIGDVDITVQPLSASYLSITFQGFYGLKSGSIACTDSMYATLEGTYTATCK